jgi:broad specificity phosphatase PhoE
MAAIILVRHAPTAWTGSRYCGRSDPSLDATGVAVAQRLASELAPALAPGTRIVSSPSRRTHATAAAIASTAGVADITIDDRWREADCGIAEGLTFEELERAAPDLARRLADGDTAIDWPGGESAEELERRVSAAWEDAVGSGADLVIVSHAGPLRIALAIATGRPAGAVEFPGPGSVIRLDAIPSA